MEETQDFDDCPRGLLGVCQFGSHLLCAFYDKVAIRTEILVVATVLHQEARIDVPRESCIGAELDGFEVGRHRNIRSG